MITFAVGNLEIKLWLVRDAFSSWRVEWEKYENQYTVCLLLSVKKTILKVKKIKDNCQQ